MCRNAFCVNSPVALSYPKRTRTDWSDFVKLLLAIIQPTKLDTVRNALVKIGIESMTVCDARGYARQRGQSPTYRGHEYKANLLRKVAVEIVVHEDRLERVIETVTNVSRTGPNGTIGDGKILLLPVDDAIRLSDGVRGPEAV
jgi:nitrogen regulatory protein P-II 1